MIDAKVKRVEDPNDAARCQRVIAGHNGGQCWYYKHEDSDYCLLHGGNKGEEANRKAGLKNYRLGKWQARVSEFADSQGIKSLREEVGVLRIILEEVMTKCNDSSDLLMFSPKITDLVMKIEKVVSSCHKLELGSGLLMDKTTALILGGKIVEIISRFETNDEVIRLISDELTEAILNTNKPVE